MHRPLTFGSDVTTICFLAARCVRTIRVRVRLAPPNFFCNHPSAGGVTKSKRCRPATKADGTLVELTRRRADSGLRIAAPEEAEDEHRAFGRADLVVHSQTEVVHAALTAVSRRQFAA